MPDAYLIAQIRIDDRDTYRQYETGFMEIFSKYAGEIVAVDEAVDVLEGAWPYTRTVVLRFPSVEEARRWYDSPEYQALAQHRFRASSANLVLAQGLPPTNS